MKRVLVYGLSNNRGGTEAVIANYAGALEGKVAFDFIVFEEPNNYAQLFASGQNRFFVLPSKRTQLARYYPALKAHFEEHAGEYAAVWANLNILNNIDLLTYGQRYGIERRILHAHNSHDDGRLHQRVLTKLHRPTVQKYVTDRWAVSREAGEYMFAGYDYRIVPNAIQAAQFAFDAEAGARVRSELGLSAEHHVCGCVGRLAAQKNYGMLLSVWPAVLHRRPEARLVLVGDGELRSELEAQAAREGVQDTVVFAGARGDIGACLSAFDMFVMPSLFEGLGLSLLEAQFNGLTCVVSDTIPSEANISTGLRYLALDDVHGWVEALVSCDRGQESLLTERAQTYDLAWQAPRIAELFEA